MDPMKRILIEAIVDLAAFIDMADEDTIDEDAALDRLEHPAASLHDMTMAQQKDFLRYIQVIAQEKEQRGANRELVEWVRTFGEDFGLSETEATNSAEH